MRIAIDARELAGQRTGVGRYLGELLTAWDQLPAARDHVFIRLQPGPGEGGTMWEQLTLPRLVRDANAQVLFSPGYTAPLRSPVPTVVAVHDVSFAAHPEWFSWREGARRRIITRLAAKRAAKVLTISEFSRREIVQYLEIPAAKVEVIYPGITHPVAARTLTVAEAAPQGAPRTSSDSTVLYVGSLFNRRHIPELVAGFRLLAARRPDVRLEIVGDNRTRPRIDVATLTGAPGPHGVIGVHSYVADGTLAQLYGRARAFVFLSAYEGFGFTPLEALSWGIPIVVLDTAVAREVCGDAAIYVSSPTPGPIEAALERALFDDRERGRVLDAAPAVLSRYSWPRCAERVLEVLVSCRA